MSSTATSDLHRLLQQTGWDARELSRRLGTSFYTTSRWVRGDITPSPEYANLISRFLAGDLTTEKDLFGEVNVETPVFASRGIRQVSDVDDHSVQTSFAESPGPYLLTRLKRGSLWGDGEALLGDVLAEHAEAAKTPSDAVAEGVSAGKNTYTYDAHTYHTKVPPQGIATVIQKYLPDGGLILDPFAGSGMTGVAALATGNDVVLNELSPAASFIANRFTSRLDPKKLAAAVKGVCAALGDLRRRLYTTECRTCSRPTELLFTVWSYKVNCTNCQHEFVLWDECRSYGNTVREHKFLKEFPCPHCGVEIKKSRLKRTESVPVLVGYKCCSKVQSEVPPSAEDLRRLQEIDEEGLVDLEFAPDFELPDGVNLAQPKKHGLVNIRDFYTKRNLAAMSQIWKQIHKIEDEATAGFAGFVFTSLYQRVTKLSEYRFWGGSGNTANFNVPYIFNEANVFVTFERKARSIIDHLETTALSYRGRAVIRTGSATDLGFLPPNSIDLIFTDPPFGANINYSEMNMLWESWLKTHTDNTSEAIVNRVQRKDAGTYQELMTKSLKECHRVLRDGHWMVLVFMNSAEDIWARLRQAVLDAGFSIERVDIFDKQHGTFKQFVSDNTAGSDLMLHCRKIARGSATSDESQASSPGLTVGAFLAGRKGSIPMLPYLHVKRETHVDYRTLYSEFLAACLVIGAPMIDFASFRTQTDQALENRGDFH